MSKADNIRKTQTRIVSAVLARIESQVADAKHYPHLRAGMNAGDFPIILSVRDAATLHAFLHSLGFEAGEICHSTPARMEFLSNGYN